MPRSWKSYEEQIDSGPWPALKVVLVGLFVLSTVGVGCSAFAYGMGWFSEAAQVAQEEFGARALLTKYEWFKEASAALDAKRASIGVYERRFEALKAEYGSQPRSAWSREDREQWNLWTAEVAGVTASYNLLAADYNAQMAKFHWQFANVGQLPQGATQPLPREYKPYETGAR